LDGEMNFQYSAPIVSFLSKGVYASIPNMIVVGINNTDRTRDLTPTNAPIGDPADKKIKLFTSSGGAENFKKFLKDELIPTIDSSYRTNGYKILSGHSFGGLFAIHTLITTPELFNAYIALDPSLWWDNGKTLQDAELFLQKNSLKGKSLYIGLANTPSSPRDLASNHPQAIQQFTKEILPKEQSKLRWDWKFYEDEDHGTISLPAFYDALKFLYKGFQLPVKEIPYSPQIVKEQYLKLSERIGFNLPIDNNLLDQLIDYCQRQGFPQSAEELKKLKP